MSGNGADRQGDNGPDGDSAKPETGGRHNASPINPLPALVWLLILPIAGIEAALWLGGQGLIGGPQALGWRLEAAQRWGFSGAVQTLMLENRHFPPHLLARYASFSFIHGNPLHALFVVVLLAALGKHVAEAFGTLRSLAVIVPATLGGAVAFGLFLGEHEMAWLIGGFPMAFALAGAATWWRWHDAGQDSGRWRAFGLIGGLVLARLGLGLTVEPGHGWIADLVALGLGFGLAALFGPGGWSHLRARLRERG